MNDSVEHPYACPRCKNKLLKGESHWDCQPCGVSFPINDEISDFSGQTYYDSFDPGQHIPEESQIGLQNEEEGIRNRIEDYYVPLFKDRQVGSQSRILDCGCGNGLSVDLLRAAGFLAWGNDLSQLRKWQWQNRQHRSCLFVGDGGNLPVKSGFFDFVVCSGVLEHIGVTEVGGEQYSVDPNPDRHSLRSAFVEELLRVTKPGGRLFLDFPNGSFPIDFWHGPQAGGMRFHSPSEGFLPHVSEIRKYVNAARSPGGVKVLSPNRRLRFNQVGRHWYGRLFRLPVDLLFRLTTIPGFRWLAGSSLNPYLVLEIRKPLV